MALYQDIDVQHNDPAFAILMEALSHFTHDPIAVPIHELGPENGTEVLGDIQTKIQSLDSYVSASTHQSLSAVKEALYVFKTTNTTIPYPLPPISPLSLDNSPQNN